jgi:hypothetical protein
MNRILSLGAVLFVAISLFAKDTPCHEADQMFIATTGHIIKIDAAARTMLVRGSEGFPKQKRTIVLQQRTTSGIPNLDEYTVATTSDTMFRDGGDSIQFEDFKIGETISIHGVLSGSTLTASRVAKWD